MSPQPQSMDNTTGQETNCPTNTAMLFVIFFLRRKKNIYWKVRILHYADEDKQRITLQDFPQKRKC